MNYAAFNNYKFAYDGVSAAWPERIYRSLKEMFLENGPDKIYVIRSMWIRKAETDENGNITDGSMHELNPVVTLDGCFANIPYNQLEQFNAILSTDTIIADVDAGKVGFKIREYDNKYRKGEKCYAANWCNVEA